MHGSSTHRRRMRMLAALSIVTRRLPTQLHPQQYNSIACTLSSDHFKLVIGMVQDEFEELHFALLLPDPFRIRNRDVINSKTALLMLLAWLRRLAD